MKANIIIKVALVTGLYWSSQVTAGIISENLNVSDFNNYYYNDDSADGVPVSSGDITNSLSFSGFDASLGTLDSVSLSYYAEVRSYGGLNSGGLTYGSTGTSTATIIGNSAVSIFGNDLATHTDTMNVSCTNENDNSGFIWETRCNGSNRSDSDRYIFNLNLGFTTGLLDFTSAFDIDLTRAISVDLTAASDPNMKAWGYTNLGYIKKAKVDYYYTEAQVPEPSIIALFAAGLFGLGFARRRMRS